MATNSFEIGTIVRIGRGNDTWSIAAVDGDTASLVAVTRDIQSGTYTRTRYQGGMRLRMTAKMDRLRRVETVPSDTDREAAIAAAVAEINDPARRLALALAHVESAKIAVDAAMHAAMPVLPDDDAARASAARASNALLELAIALDAATAR